MTREPHDLRDEYPADLIRSGVRGKYAGRFREGRFLVAVDPDLRQHFLDAASVNRALREFVKRGLDERSEPKG